MDDNSLIYFDNNATTKTDDRVIETMLPFFKFNYANPSSHHSFGQSAKKAVEESRLKIASILGAESHEIIFTSGSTESINLAIKGIAEAYSYKGKHLITLQTEHKAVLDVCGYLEAKGFDITYLPVNSDGLLILDDLRNALRPDTILVSIMYVNNETGVIQPLKSISEICHEKDVMLFSDATQAVGKIPINVNDIQIDLMCFSGHKFYGPKGIGGLFVRKGC